MEVSGELTRGVLNSNLDPDPEWEEEWHVLISSSKEPYVLSKKQAKLIQEVIASGSRGIVMFQTFSISIPYITEFYRQKRFLKDAKQLPERATELPYNPSPEQLERIESIKTDLRRKMNWVKKEENDG